MTENYNPGLMPCGESQTISLQLSKLWTCLQRRRNVAMMISGNKGFAAEETKVRFMADLH